MARIRSLKPEMWSSESVGRLSRYARLLLVELITQVDDEGRIRASSRGLASLYPFDDDAASLIDGWLAELEAEGMFVRYLADGATYGHLPKFKDHQKIDHPSKSKLPEFTEPLANPREASRILAPDQGSRIRMGVDQGSRIFFRKLALPVSNLLAKFLNPSALRLPRRTDRGGSPSQWH